jgi:hypothetical protein
MNGTENERVFSHTHTPNHTNCLLDEACAGSSRRVSEVPSVVGIQQNDNGKSAEENDMPGTYLRCAEDVMEVVMVQQSKGEESTVVHKSHGRSESDVHSSVSGRLLGVGVQGLLGSGQLMSNKRRSSHQLIPGALMSVKEEPHMVDSNPSLGSLKGLRILVVDDSSKSVVCGC